MIINGNEILRGSILMAYFVMWHLNGFYPFKWLLLDTFLPGDEESSALDTEQNKTSLEHNIKTIRLNFAYQLFSQIYWKREQKLEASEPTKTRMLKNKRKRTKEVLKPVKNGKLPSYIINKMIAAEFALNCEKGIKHTSSRIKRFADHAFRKKIAPIFFLRILLGP